MSEAELMIWYEGSLIQKISNWISGLTLFLIPVLLKCNGYRLKQKNNRSCIRR